jgi:predicted hotdog family 3-hydroxylacyl-ACP dehydratase
MTPLPPVGELIPHRAPMILLDEMLELTPERAVAAVRITPQSQFFEDGEVPSVVMIEYMAQTIAAFAGSGRRSSGQPIELGFLLGCREMTIDVDALRPGDEVRIEIRSIWQSDKLGQFACEARMEGRTIAKAIVNVYQGRLEDAGMS